ncbi:hypothetical protein BGZ73_001859 [Actinomortierella ambigua]|nr:hypothetical protein BGZ73_001859 [Actinomortierella ambigua]
MKNGSPRSKMEVQFCQQYLIYTMKLSFVAALAAAALAATSDAANSMVRLYNLDNHKGDCRQFPVYKYDVCYTISEFYLPRSARYFNADPHKNELTVTFFETGNCGGKYTRASGPMKQNVWHGWGKLDNVYGIAGSVMVHGAATSAGSGKVTQYKPAFNADWSNC